MLLFLRRFSLLAVGLGFLVMLVGCSSGLGVTAETPVVALPSVTARPTVTPTPVPSPTLAPIATFTPTPTPTPEPPPPPPPPTPPNAMGGQTDGGNTANTPVVEDTGPQSFAVGRVSEVNDDEFRYTVVQDDQVLAIASRFNLQVADVVRVNFRCSDPLEVQPGDVLDIRWPVDSEQIGSC